MRTQPTVRDRRPTWPSGDPVTVGHPVPLPAAAGRGAPGVPTGLALPAVVLGLGVSRMLLTGGYAGLRGAAAWGVLAAVVGALTAFVLLVPRVPALARRADEAARVRSALEARVDPGPALRTRVDVAARRLVRLHWAGRVMPVVPVVLLLQGRWDSPATALPAAVVVVAGYTALALAHRRRTRAAAAWVADRPGPPRAVPPPPWWEPWLGGRRVVGLTAGYVLAVALIAVLTGP